MTIQKLKENAPVILFGAWMISLVICSLIVRFNLLDFSYLVFLAICFVRYIFICKEK